MLAGQAAELARQSPNGGNSNPEKLIAFAVVAGAGLEEALEKNRIVGVGELAQASPGNG